jgi:drug/metabolite transporter (DMT)-like permease
MNLMDLRRNRSQLAAWAALLVVYLVWGSTYLAIRVGVRDIPPLAMAGSRFLIAGAILYPIATRTGDAATRTADRPGPREWLGCAVVGVLLLAFGNGGVSVAEQTLPSGLAAVLVATVPLWMVLFAVPLQGTRVSRRAVVGLLVGLVGVAVLAGGGSAAGHAVGVVIVLGAAASWGVGSVLSRRLRMPRRVLLSAAIEMLAGGTVLLIAAAVTGQFARVHLASVHATSWLALAWLIAAGSILAFTAYGYALTRLPLSTVSTYAYVNPVVAVLLGTTLLHEALTVREVIGAALVVGSVALTLNRASDRNASAAEAPAVPARDGPGEERAEEARGRDCAADAPGRVHAADALKRERTARA